MQEAALSLFFLLAGLPALDANDPEDKNSPFYYDWHSLQIGGLICAVVLSTIGIVVVMSECGSGGSRRGGKCKCKFRQKYGAHHLCLPSRQSGDAPPLITPGKA
uniref:FXYD domain-containing ion transport regulator n=1 Tax=Propithecus coquereli TaxID=379532 RepID=A0A2K6FYU3_PROCO